MTKKQLFKLLFSGVVIFFTTNSSFAQEESEKFSISQIQSFLADSIYQRELDRALYWESEGSDNKDSIYDAYLAIAQKLWLNDEYNSVLTFLNQLMLYEDISEKPSQSARIHNFYANAALRTSQYETALSHYKQCLDIYDSINEPEKQAIVLINICVAYEQMGEYEKALYYGKRSFNLFKEVDAGDRRYSICYTNLGNVYSSLQIYDTALTYYNKSIAIDADLNDSSGVSYGFSNIGWLYYDKGNFDSALKYFMKSAIIDSLYGSDYEQMVSSHNFGNLLYEQEGQRGIPYLERSYQLACQINSLEYLKKNAKVLGEAYTKQGAIEKAVQFYQSMYPVYDSLYDIQKTQGLSETMKSYDLYKSGLENEILKNKNFERQQELVTAKSQMLYVSVIGILLVIVVVTLVRGRKKLIKQRKLLTDRNRVIGKQKNKVEALFRENQELSSILVHDLRAPFSQIQVLKEILDENPDYIKEDKDILMLMEKAAQNGLLLVEDLLMISRVSNWKHKIDIESATIKDIFDSAFSQFDQSATAKNITFESNLRESDVEVTTDISLLRGIVENLISNAIKYTQPGGEVNAAFRFSASGELTFIVSDNGPGFSEDDKKELYQKFAKLSARPTGNETSTGLGLAIVKLYTDKLSGAINLESVRDKGAIFTVVLPQLSHKN